MDKVAYLFSGQGSQYVGMGRDLYDSFPESRAIFDKTDKILEVCLTELIFNGPQDELTKTVNCQPAILTLSIAAWEAFNKVTKSQSHKVTGFAAGLSLGEYSALVAAGALSFEDAVYLVRRRGEFMEEAARKNPGKMLSLIGLTKDKVQQICADTGTEIANINSPSQIVISGGVKEIERAKKRAVKLGARMAIVLEVSGAFHSSFMKDASLRLAKELEKIKVSSPSMPVISNVTANQFNLPQEIKANLVKQVSSSVLWEDSMRLLLSKGISKFYEFGPGKVLRGLMRYIEANAQVVNIEKKEDILNL